VQQLLTLLRQQCWELLNACWQWCANGCNNLGRIQPISLCKPCVMSVRGPNNVGRAVQTDPTLLRYASAITEQKKPELLAEKFDRFQTLRNNTEQHPTTCNRVCKRPQHVTSNNVASVCTGLYREDKPKRLFKITAQVYKKKVHFRLTCVAQKRRCLTSLLSQFKHWELPLMPLK